MPVQKGYPFDKELSYRAKGSAAVAASGYVGTQKDQGGAVLTEMVLVLNIEAIDVANGDEAYTFRVVGSQTPDRSDARVLAEYTVGDAAAKPIDTADDMAGEQHVIQFNTQRAGYNQRYLDLRLDVAGTTPSITFSAFLSKKMG
jgi:hypothetical protein